MLTYRCWASAGLGASWLTGACAKGLQQRTRQRQPQSECLAALGVSRQPGYQIGATILAAVCAPTPRSQRAPSTAPRWSCALRQRRWHVDACPTGPTSVEGLEDAKELATRRRRRRWRRVEEAEKRLRRPDFSEGRRRLRGDGAHAASVGLRHHSGCVGMRWDGLK